MSGELVETDEDTHVGEAEGTDKRRLGRRALMLGTATGVGAAAALVAGASPAGAANGDTVTVGGSVIGTDPTEITNTGGTGIYGISDATSGITGYTAGVLGDSNSTSGVVGLANCLNGNGVMGISNLYTGLPFQGTGVVGE